MESAECLLGLLGLLLEELQPQLLLPGKPRSGKVCRLDSSRKIVRNKPLFCLLRSFCTSSHSLFEARLALHLPTNTLRRHISFRMVSLHVRNPRNPDLRRRISIEMTSCANEELPSLPHSRAFVLSLPCLTGSWFSVSKRRLEPPAASIFRKAV